MSVSIMSESISCVAVFSATGGTRTEASILLDAKKIDYGEDISWKAIIPFNETKPYTYV